MTDDTYDTAGFVSLCLVIPIAFHGIYDFLALMSASGVPGLFLLLILLLIGLVVAAFRIIKVETDKKEVLMATWHHQQREQNVQPNDESIDV